MNIYEILKDTNYKTEQFSQESIDRLNNKITEKVDVKGKVTPYVECLVRKNKQIVLKPEEIVRQLLIDKLINEYGYPVSRMQLEYPVYFGREVKRADIVIWDAPDLDYLVYRMGSNLASKVIRGGKIV